MFHLYDDDLYDRGNKHENPKVAADRPSYNLIESQYDVDLN